jgi:uncharacterized protein (DUF433 family)
MPDLLARITINPKQCSGRPCIRGMRIRVSDILDLFVAGLDAEQILAEMPDLEADDLKAALFYASRKLDRPVLVSHDPNFDRVMEAYKLGASQYRNAMRELADVSKL